MIIKLLLILSLFYGFTIHGQINNKVFRTGENLEGWKHDYKSDKSPEYMFEALREQMNNKRTGVNLEGWKHDYIQGETNPESLTWRIKKCLLSVDIHTHDSIKLVFVDREAPVKKIKIGRYEVIDIPGFCPAAMSVSGTEIMKIGDGFLFDADGHHTSTSLRLLEINKEQVVFEYTNEGFFGYLGYQSTEIGILNLELGQSK